MALWLKDTINFLIRAGRFCTRCKSFFRPYVLDLLHDTNEGQSSILCDLTAGNSNHRVVSSTPVMPFLTALRYSHNLNIKNSIGSVTDLRLTPGMLYNQRYLKHTKKSSGKKEISEEEDFSDDEEIEEDEFDAENVHFEEDENFPPNYRDLLGHVKNLRLDSVVGFGLAMNRSKVEDYFLNSKLRLNGGRVLKKSIKVGSGDFIDVITDHREGMMVVKRVRVVKVKMHGDATKATVYLRVWRGGAKIPVTKEKFTKNT